MVLRELSGLAFVTLACSQYVFGGTGANGGFTTLSPDANFLVWDETQPILAKKGYRAGWLSVPMFHDATIAPFETPPQRCLRIIMKPAAKQPARLGPIMLHCGGPGSDASCALGMAAFLELNSSYLVGPPLSEDYDYWSISQRGMDQLESANYLFPSPCPFKDTDGASIPSWPSVQCNGIERLVNSEGVEEVLRRLPGKPNLSTWTKVLQPIQSGFSAKDASDLFNGVPFFDETYVRWLYRLIALEHNLCINHDERYKVRTKTREYNTFHHSGTNVLAYDIDLFRAAIGASKMSIFGISYGTKVASVYATIFHDRIHRLILDGNMGPEPDVLDFARWVGQSTEEVWTGLAAACDNSVMSGMSPGNSCPAGPDSTSKLQKLFRDATTPEEVSKAAALFNAVSQVVYAPGVPGAYCLMKCLEDLHATGNVSSCQFAGALEDGGCNYTSSSDPVGFDGFLGGGLDVIGSVIGLDTAGRLTEHEFVKWWRTEKEFTLGITRSLTSAAVVAAWPTLPRPNPPAGHPTVAPLVVGNLFDGQTPYANAQRMLELFPSGSLLTTQFYGHGRQLPESVAAVVQRYEDEMKRGVPPTYDNEAAKLLCIKVLLQYLKSGEVPRDHVCKAAGPAPTGPGKLSHMLPKASSPSVPASNILV